MDFDLSMKLKDAEKQAEDIALALSCARQAVAALEEAYAIQEQKVEGIFDDWLKTRRPEYLKVVK